MDRKNLLKKICLLTTLLLIAMTGMYGQKNDYHWRFGYRIGHDNLNYISSLDFNRYGEEAFISSEPESKQKFKLTCAIANDAEGNFLFSYDGTFVENKLGRRMENESDMLLHGEAGGEFFPQTALILPAPGSDSLYFLFYMAIEVIEQDFHGRRVYCSVIDMSANEGVGKVVEKRKIVLEDTLGLGHLAAVKHANGRDWWLVVPRYLPNQFHTILVSPDGIETIPVQTTGLAHKRGVGRTQFSMDGSKYATSHRIGSFWGNYAVVYDFDRCSGLFSNQKTYHDESRFNGAVLSPNGKILYILGVYYILQVDLEADDLKESRKLVALKDDFTDYLPDRNLYLPSHDFFWGAQAPDGKIYITSDNHIRVLTTIDNPDVWGEGCNVSQHSLFLPTLNLASIPYFPNFRLGPLEHSGCDTLGLVNTPLSRFRLDQDKEDHQVFRMLDLSDYEPKEWFWDFGDGNTSTQRHPLHSYEQQGIYEICLKVSNIHGEDISCQSIETGTTSIREKLPESIVTLYPNPVGDYVNINWQGYYPESAELVLYDTAGRQIRRISLRFGNNVAELRDLQRGIYIYTATDAGRLIGTGKLVKM